MFKTIVKRPQKILYCSSLCSEKIIDFLYKTSRQKPLLSVQKFHRLFVEGISANGIAVTALSAIPASKSSHSKIWWNYAVESDKIVKYIYLPFINIPYVRQFFIALFSFIQVLWWCLHSKRESSIIICDVLNVAVSITSLIVAKTCGFRTCAIVTDIPVILGNSVKKREKKSQLEKLAIRISSSFLTSYDSYVLLTKYMNDLINSQKKPFIVMEGLVDINMEQTDNALNKKAIERILIYAGEISEKYGIRNLLEAFMQLVGDDLRLHIYGSGEMKDDIPHFESLDKRIVYQGVVPNQLVVKKQIEATLLINPRFSNQEFTKYSFPSKNMEYMVSGTPLVTTPLAGMPEEYYDYVYLFDDESVKGMFTTLKSLLSKSRDELHNFGCKAKQFALANKNNYIQAERLLRLFERV